MNAYRQAVDDTIDAMFSVYVLADDMRQRGATDESIALAVWERSQEITRTLERLFETDEGKV